MKIPHDPVALEEHFRDDNEGPLSNQGYMPYLNRFILDKVGANDPEMQKHLFRVRSYTFYFLKDNHHRYTGFFFCVFKFKE